MTLPDQASRQLASAALRSAARGLRELNDEHAGTPDEQESRRHSARQVDEVSTWLWRPVTPALVDLLRVELEDAGYEVPRGIVEAALHSVFKEVP